MTVKAIVSEFLSSEYFTTWSAEHVESGAYSRNRDRRDRFSRCYDAATDGADGSTHRECIEDMREAFRDYIRYGRPRKGSAFKAHPDRLETAVLAYFDDLEDWHDRNGSLDQAVG